MSMNMNIMLRAVCCREWVCAPVALDVDGGGNTRQRRGGHGRWRGTGRGGERDGAYGCIRREDRADARDRKVGPGAGEGDAREEDDGVGHVGNGEFQVEAGCVVRGRGHSNEAPAETLRLVLWMFDLLGCENVNRLPAQLAGSVVAASGNRFRGDGVSRMRTRCCCAWGGHNGG